MKMCSGDDSALTADQKKVLNDQKQDINNRKDDIKTYFGDLRRQSQTQFNLDAASRLDKFLVESYNLDKKEEADVLKAKGMTNFETLYENERAVELSASEFRRQGQEANLKFRADEIERNKARFDTTDLQVMTVGQNVLYFFQFHLP